MSCPYCKFIKSYQKECTGGYYPQEVVDQSHYYSYCLYNNQNNGKECNFFPANETWHYCGECGEGVYDSERFCPTCGSRQ